MNTYNFTFGTELEFADVDIFSALPFGCSWNKKDYSIVNSNGIANDPSGEIWRYGGEINTKPTDSIEEQLKIIEQIIKRLSPKPVINYKCNLHVHVGYEGVEKDLAGLKKIIKLAHEIPASTWDTIDPIEFPQRDYFKSEEEFKAAKKRYRRNLVSHRYQLNPKKLKLVLASNSVEEFINKHATQTNGKLHWAITPRCGINLRQINETKTIEFRHFFGTLNLKEYESCLTWCRDFVFNALNDLGLPATEGLVFPKPKRYDHRLGLGFEKTNHHSNKKLDIIKNINSLNKKI